MKRKQSKKISQRQREVMNNPLFQKELFTLKRKYSIPKGEALKEMLTTEAGQKRYTARKTKWEAFNNKWKIVFMIGDRPVFRTGNSVRSSNASRE